MCFQFFFLISFHQKKDINRSNIYWTIVCLQILSFIGLNLAKNIRAGRNTVETWVAVDVWVRLSIQTTCSAEKMVQVILDDSSKDDRTITRKYGRAPTGGRLKFSTWNSV